MKLRIGEMASLFNISTDTLRYYDKEGLLCPKKDEESGYRYYEFTHFDPLYYILFLRSLDVSIGEIKNLMANRTITGIQSLLTTRKEHLQREMNKLQQLEEKVCTHLQTIENVIMEKPPEIVPTPPFVATLYPQKHSYEKSEILMVGKSLSENYQSEQGVFLFKRKPTWTVTHWGTLREGKEGEQVLFTQSHCLTGYITATFDEIHPIFDKLEKEYSNQGIMIGDELLLVESFYIGEGEDSKTISKFYLPIIQKS